MGNTKKWGVDEETKIGEKGTKYKGETLARAATLGAPAPQKGVNGPIWVIQAGPPIHITHTPYYTP